MQNYKVTTYDKEKFVTISNSNCHTTARFAAELVYSANKQVAYTLIRGNHIAISIFQILATFLITYLLLSIDKHSERNRGLYLYM